MNAPPPLSDATTLVLAVSILLVPLAAAAIAVINAGLGRSRSAAHSMVASLCVMGVAAVVTVAFGSSFAGAAGGPGHGVQVVGRSWSVLGAGRFFARDLAGSLPALLQAFGIAIAALIPLGSGGDRWRLGPICISTALLAGVVYPLFSHWVWGGGWLAQLGPNLNLGRGFVDAGGSSVIHGVGGFTALAIAWIIGHRRGKYANDGMPAAFPAHNSVLVLFGCLLALPGWMGLNVAGALLFAGAGVDSFAGIAMLTFVAAASAGLSAALVTRVRFGKPDASLIANGWMAGLVSSSAGCALLTPLAAVATGALAGALVARTIEMIEVHLGIDDPGGSISVHGLAGVWGILAVGIFGRSAPGQLLAQAVGAATLLGFVLPFSYALNWLLDRVYRQRAPAEGERVGMDLYELGAGAYPDFLTHSDEFIHR